MNLVVALFVNGSITSTLDMLLQIDSVAVELFWCSQLGRIREKSSRTTYTLLPGFQLVDAKYACEGER